MREAELTQLIASHPDRGDVPVEAVKAVCMVESSFDEWAMRYEPRWKWLMGNDETIDATERVAQMTSFGLMQVMGAVAREYRYAGYLTKLCDPSTGLRYGLLHLRKYFQKYGNWPDALASYNAGSPRKGADERYFNQSYIDKVLKYWAQYERAIPLKETEV